LNQAKRKHAKEKLSVTKGQELRQQYIIVKITVPMMQKIINLKAHTWIAYCLSRSSKLIAWQ
jgi:hypothetical protein